MLLSNQIPGVLKTEIRTIDNKDEFYYDITSKRQVYNVFEKGQLRYEQIKRVMSFMIQTIEKASEYMLRENDFVLDPEYVYIQLSSFELSLCYLEGYNKNLLHQITEFIEYLMNKVDHKDESAVLLIYSLYKVSREEECNLERLKNVIEERKQAASPIICREQKENVAKPVKNQINTGISNEELDEERTVVLAVFDSQANYLLKSLSHNEGEDIVIHSFPFFVGKQRGNADMIIEHSTISRCHAKFELVEGEVFLTDLNSTNGTYINHIRLDSHAKTQVKEEDEIMFANARYEFLRG